jgi:hypothetical protein
MATGEPPGALQGSVLACILVTGKRREHMPIVSGVEQEKQRVFERLARLDAERAKLGAQLNELEIAERVLLRFGKLETTERRRKGRRARTTLVLAAERRTRAAQPAHGLSLSDATLKAVLAHPEGVNTNQIFSYLSREFGITVRPNHLGIALQRHRRAGRLENLGQRWFFSRQAAAVGDRGERRAEKQRISERLARLDAERTKVSDQLDELEVAETVLSRFGKAEPLERRRRGRPARSAPAPAGEHLTGDRLSLRDVTLGGNSPPGPVDRKADWGASLRKPGIEPRRVNAWIEDGELPLIEGGTYRFGINIGAPRSAVMAAPEFREPDWQGRESLEILILLGGSGFVTAPGVAKVVLPPQGSTKPAFFEITPVETGAILLRISLFLIPELVLLQEFELPIDVLAAREAA